MLNNKVKTGLVILAALAAAALVIVNLGDIGFREKYSFYILFDDIADLPPQAAVKISGVEVGRVSSIDLHKGRARVNVRMEKDIQLRTNTTPQIMRMGLIGHTYLSLTPGTDDSPPIKDGDTVEGISPLAYEEVLDSFISGLDEASKLIKDLGKEKEIIENINRAFESLRDTGDTLKAALGPEGYKLTRALDNISMVAENIDGVMEKETASVSDAVEKLSSVSEKMDGILTGLTEGRGVAGRLLTSEEFAGKFTAVLDEIHRASEDLRHATGRFGGMRTAWESDVYHDFQSGEFRSGGGVNLLAPSERFLRLRVENLRPHYSPRYDEGGERVNSLTVVGGKQIGSLNVYGGAIRSSGGLGARYSWGGGLDTAADVYDFYADRPRLDLRGRLKLVDFLRVGVSYEDLLEEGGFRTGILIELK